MAPHSTLALVALLLQALSTPALGLQHPSSSLSPRTGPLRARHTQPGTHAGLARVKRQALAGAGSSVVSSSAAASAASSAAASAAGGTGTAAAAATTSSSSAAAEAAVPVASSSSSVEAVVPTTTTTTTPQAVPTTTTTTEQPQTTTTTTTPEAVTISKTTTTKAASTTTSTSAVSIVVVTAVITNSNGALTTSLSSSLPPTSASPSSTAKAKSAASSSSTGKTWGIIGGVAGGVVALLGLVFVGYRLSQRRFSDLDHGAGGRDGEIRWPQLQMEGQMVAAGASTLRPMGTRRTGGAGVEMDGDDEEGEEKSEWQGSEGGHAGAAGRSTEHLNGGFAGYQEGYVVGNDVYSGRPAPPASVSEHGYPTAAMPAYPPAVMSPVLYQQQPHSQYAPSATGTAPPAFAQHHGHPNFIPSYARPTDQRGDATFDFMTGQSDLGHDGQAYDPHGPSSNLHRNPSAYSQAAGGGGGAHDLHRNNSTFSQQTQLPPFSDGLAHSGSGYSFGQQACVHGQGQGQGYGQPLGMGMAGPGLHRNDTVFSEGSVYSRQTHATHVPGQRAPSPRAPSPRY